MPTALVKVRDHRNTEFTARLLLDTCSTANFITENLARKLQLPKSRCAIPVGALNDLKTITKNRMTVTIRSMHNGFEKTLEFLTIPRISGPVPAQQADRSSIRVPANIKLADPEFHKPAPIEMLLGTGPTLSLLSVGQISLGKPRGSDLLLQKTLLGWVIGGNSNISANTEAPHQKNCHITQPEFDMRKFWEIEEYSPKPLLSPEEQACEEHFKQTVSRDAAGRYVVALPFNAKKGRLGDSYAAALKRFKFLQRRLQKDGKFKQEYSAVMQEYVKLGHMSEACISPNEAAHFLPHHAVLKDTSLTTKLRVVFDGSAKTTTGVSLNDALMTGPTIQDDLFALVLRFRLHRYVITADIEKMYRQFLVREEDRRFQKILWTDSNGTVKPFELNTVTFGLSSAPFLATRCLLQLADDEAARFPNAAKTVKKDMYVDDLLTGAETIEETIALRDEIIALLACGRLHLRQWASNSPEILMGLPQGSINTKLISDNDSTLKTLGLSWNSQDDTITYTVKPLPTNITTTKRMILSEIARIFDPLGLLGPIILTAKRIMQQIWQLKLDWDESVPHSIQTEWTTFREQLPSINSLEFHRKLLLPNSTDVQLHGFCDASEKGYGACIYLRSTNAEGQIQTRLLCAKSRVAPLKTISLPRLELCGALLLATLYQTVRKSISTIFNKTTFWTDSMITLHWINTSPHLLKTFVANRVAEIQSHTEVKNWRHVASRDNPADPLSRGLFPMELSRHPMWRTGPEWLSADEACWPETKLTETPELPETRSKTCLITISTPNELLRRYSSTQKLKRIIAYCLRFKKDNNNKGTPNIEELKNAQRVMLRMLQEEEFSREVHDMRHGRRLNARSKLAPLDPFLDQDGLLRVGGRLKNAQATFSYKHPIILPRSHHITQLLIIEEHNKNLHAGIQTTLYAVRQMYWPLDGRNQVRRVIRRCVKCFRLNPPNTDYVMGNLPPQRVTEAPPFENVGTDYCGPFFVKERKFRNKKQIKIYIAVFICLCTKAVHLETVTDMTTEGFIAALRRFMARRGKCKSIHSDNGSNFVGANNELKELHELFKSDAFHQRIKDGLSEDRIEWHFIPPRSPHFGGLWESTVKRVKHHLRRVIGTELFTFEEFNTFLTEIEAILNSRPLTPLSSDPNDLTALTPGHFLIGRPLNGLPDPNYSNIPSNRLSTWQHIQKVKRDFWTRWNKEYLNELNVRHKWTHGSHSIREGTMVILKEDQVPPMQWTLGRVIKIHPGSDGVIRTVTVRTAGNDYVRNVRKLAALPIEDVNQSQPSRLRDS